MNQVLRYFILGLLCVALGVLAGHWLWPPTQRTVVTVHVDSAAVKAAEFRADSIAGVLHTEKSTRLKVEARATRASKAAQFYQALADSFRLDAENSDDGSTFVSSMFDTTLTAPDTAVVMVDSTEHRFFQDRSLHLVGEYYFPPENSFKLWATVSPSKAFFAVRDSHIVLTEPSSMSWYWYTLPAFVGAIVTLLLVRR